MLQPLDDALVSIAAAWRGGLLRPSPRAAARLAAALASGRRDPYVAVGAHAVATPDAPAVTDDRGTLTWRELDDRVRRAAAVLHRGGVRRGDRVGIALPNRTAHIVSAAATFELGAIPALCSPSLPTDRLAAQLAPCRLSVVAAACATGLDRVLVLGDDDRDLVDATPRARARRPRLSRPAEDLVLHTSGTTGRARGARLDTRSAGIGTAARYLDRLRIGRDTTLVTSLPLYHAGPVLLCGLTALAGGHVLLLQRFDDDTVVADLLGVEATHLLVVPTLVDRLCRRPADELLRLRSGPLRAVVSLGSALRAATAREALRQLGPVLIDVYGATEMGLVAIASPTDKLRRPDSVGRVLPGVRTLLVDDHGRPVPTGSAGELFVRSHATAHGFDGAEVPEGWRGALDETGWIGAGDVARLDAAGFLVIVDRRRDVVISGGVNLFPAEIEAILEQHPAVREAACAGVSDPVWGEALHAFVVLDDPAVDAEQVLTWSRTHLAHFEVPRRVHRVDALPRNATGKVLRRVLADTVTSPTGAVPA